MKYNFAIRLTLMQLVAIQAIQFNNEYDIFGSYIRQGLGKLAMKRSDGEGVKRCYNKYMPQISAITARGETETSACYKISNSMKKDQDTKAGIHLKKIKESVKDLQRAVSRCSAKHELHLFMSCVKSEATAGEPTIREVKELSSAVSNNMEATIKRIKENEVRCITTVIARTKTKTDAVFAALQNCLKNPESLGKPQASSQRVQQSAPKKKVVEDKKQATTAKPKQKRTRRPDYLRPTWRLSDFGNPVLLGPLRNRFLK